MTLTVRVSTLIVIAATLSGVPARSACAQAAPVAPSPVPPVESLFADASAKEAAVRKALAAANPLPTLLKAARTVVADYEEVVRHYPASGYSDNALWRAAMLSRDMFKTFQAVRDRSASLRLFQLLASEYPSSKLSKQTPEQVSRLAVHPAKPSPSPSPAAEPSALVTIKAIRRAVLADVVRIVIELDAEIAFHDDRLDNPSRVFIDLPSTRATSSLMDQTVRFDADTDIVRQVRVGRQPNNMTRVVLETAGVSSYSIYPLYSPFRLVIDCLRATPVVVASPSGPPIQPPSVSPTVKADARPANPPARTTAAPAPAPAPPIASVPASLPSRNTSSGLSMARQLGLGVSRIVIDPGHGGHDPGAQGTDGTEAELVLDVALRLERLLARLPGVEVVLTRRGNEFVPLQERTAIANREGADLFLSVHANASSVPAARGIETYFLNFASNQNAAAVAARENALSDQTMGTLQDVVKAITLNSKLDESRDFATAVQREMMGSLKLANKTVKDLGVKQAPFVVLIGASMPSVLAEISFITNPQEARLLKKTAYRQRIAQALFEGIRQYQLSLKRVPVLAQQQN